ncbi:MAG: phosphoadenosine phosphosulfate reductase family protein [Candidatus Hodarchaeota archaeon]
MASKNRAPRSRRRGAPYLGRIATRWCPRCDVPLLRGKTCPSCNEPLLSPNIAPPGDVRSAFDHDLGILKDACDRTFVKGTGKWMFPSTSVYLLNKVGALDLDYQVIGHGEVLGNLRFDIFTREYSFVPTLAGASLVLKHYRDRDLLDPSKNDGKAPPKTIKYKVDTERFIVEGKSVLVPGIEGLDVDVGKGDPCIVHSDNGLLATGFFLASKDGIGEMMEAGRGQVAKLRQHGPPVPIDPIKEPSAYPAVTWDRVVQVNEPLIKGNANAAVKFIKRTSDKFGLPLAVAYSGGKDSLATLLLVKKALESGDGAKPFSIFFADTGLELPEVLQNVKDVIKWGGWEGSFHQRSIGDRFWSLAESFGPPARDFRFCCHTLKASQINDMIEDIGTGKGGGTASKVLVFLGQRRYESFSRAEDKKVYTNTYVPMQVIASPIKDWTALDEWLFLLREQHDDPALPINPLYFKGHDRLGCYLCPAQSIANLETLKLSHPGLHRKWLTFLERYRGEHDYPAEWVDWGLWRFKRHKGQWKKLVERLPRPLETAVKSREIQPEQVKLHVTKGISPCTAGGYSVKAKVSIPILPRELLDWTRLVDKRIQHDEASDLLFIFEDDVRFMLYADGTMFLQSTVEGFDFEKFLSFIFGCIARGIACQQCGVCVNVCPTGSLEQDGESSQIAIKVKKCIGLDCQKCTTHCPVYHVVQGNIIEPGQDG